MSIYIVSSSERIIFAGTNLKACFDYVVAFTPALGLANLKSYSQYVRDISVNKSVNILISPGIYYVIHRVTLKKKFNINEYD
jgi:hypothetical protein